MSFWVTPPRRLPITSGTPLSRNLLEFSRVFLGQARQALQVDNSVDPHHKIWDRADKLPPSPRAPPASDGPGGPGGHEEHKLGSNLHTSTVCDEAVPFTVRAVELLQPSAAAEATRSVVSVLQCTRGTICQANI